MEQCYPARDEAVCGDLKVEVEGNLEIEAETRCGLINANTSLWP